MRPHTTDDPGRVPVARWWRYCTGVRWLSQVRSMQWRRGGPCSS
jgi:hypothetical protein